VEEMAEHKVGTREEWQEELAVEHSLTEAEAQ
jgi:hypothetical protein